MFQQVFAGSERLTPAIRSDGEETVMGASHEATFR